MNNETRNNYQQYDWLEIIKNLETKIKKGIHVASMAVVISIDGDNVKCMPFPIEEDTDTKVVSAYNLTQATFKAGDKVLLIYTDRDFRYNKDNVTTDSNSVTETSNATLHSDLYGIILPKTFGKGVKGNDGVGVQSVYTYYALSDDNKNKPGKVGDTKVWSTKAETVNATQRYLWSYHETNLTSGVSYNSEPVVCSTYGKDGKDGNSVSSVEEYYLATNTTTTPSLKDFILGTDVVDTISEEKPYLWNYEKTTIGTDTKCTTPALIGKWSSDGRGIVSITNYYEKSTSNTIIPHDYSKEADWSSWKTKAPELDSEYKYLWNFEVVEYNRVNSKNETKEVTTPSVIGVYGDTGESGRGISKIVTQYALSVDLTEPTEWDESKKTPNSTSKYLWQRSRTEYTNGETDDWTTAQIIGIFGKDGSDATVNFANVCTALGISADVTNKGLYIAKDSDGNDTLAINANAIYTDSLWAEKIQAVAVTTEQLKSVTISASQLDIAPTSYKYINNYNTLADWRNNNFKCNIINTDTFNKNEGSMSVYGEYYTSTTTYAGTSKNMDIYPNRLYFTTKTYNNGLSTITPTSTEYCLNFPSTGAYEEEVTDELDGNTGNDGTLATREYVKGYLSAVLTGDEAVTNSKCSYALSIGNEKNNYTYSDLANLFDSKSDTTHTHNISLASGNTTSSITLASGQKYTLTAGGQSITFTTPSDNNTWRGIQNNLTSTSTTDSLSAYQGNLLSVAKVNKEEVLDNDIDLNTVTTSGFYRFQASMKNGPGGTSSSTFCGYGQLLVVHGGGDTISQLVMPYSSSTVYMRNGNAVNNTGGVWQSWVTLATKNDLSGFCKATYESSTGVLKLTVS